MAKDVIRITAFDGSPVEFVKKEDPPSGAMKYVYFSPRKDYVVAFFKEKQNAEQRPGCPRRSYGKALCRT